MKLSDQIALLRETLDDFGGVLESESVGEAAARTIRKLDAQNERLVLETEFQQSTQSDKDRIAELEDELDKAAKRILELEVAPAADGKCDSCSWFKTTGQVPRLCVNPEAWLQGFSRRGYSTKAGYGCEAWSS